MPDECKNHVARLEYGYGTVHSLGHSINFGFQTLGRIFFGFGTRTHCFYENLAAPVEYTCKFLSKDFKGLAQGFYCPRTSNN